MSEIFEDVWSGLYGESCKGVISDDAFAHPAKFSRALIRKIYDHVVEEGWATRGSSVVDPFGGVALGGLDAMRHGLNWYGVELEEKFFKLGNQNIALWNERYSRLPNWGTARLLQGDSRKLAEVLSAAECCVSSPPYAGYDDHGGRGTAAERDRRRLERLRPELRGRFDTCFKGSEEYGTAEGQLGAMREGDHAVAISSPPYIDTPVALKEGRAQQQIESLRRAVSEGRVSGRESLRVAEKGFNKNTNLNSSSGQYGSTEGQLGAMPEGQLCVSSPPFESSLSSGELKPEDALRIARNQNDKWKQGRDEAGIQNQANNLLRKVAHNYGREDNLGNQRGETFWSASRLILEQLHSVLTPDAHAVFVTKRFVRDKKIVEFTDQWIQLCEAVGFKLLHRHKAMLVEDYGVQRGFETDKSITIARKSFFRRLAESKNSPAIDWEDVTCFVRPA